MRKNKAIVFGGLGFLGYEITKRLCSIGFNCDVVDIKPNKKLLNELNKKFGKKINFYFFDISKSDLNKKIRNNYNFIFDCAATLGVDRVMKNSYESFLNNIKNSINISLFAKKQKKLKKVIFMSSSEIYDGSLEYGIVKPPNKENSVLAISDMYHPRTVYMFSKIAGEILQINSKLPYLNLRLHNIFGPRMYENHSIPTFIRKLSTKKKVEIFNKNHVRSYIFIDDAVEQIIKLSLKNNLKNKTFNIGSTENIYTNKSLALLIKSLMNSNAKFFYSLDNKKSIAKRIPSILDLKKQFKIKYKKKFRENLLKTIKYYEK